MFLLSFVVLELILRMEQQTASSPVSSVLSSTVAEMASVRAELLAYFTHVLLGDGLAAEFLLLHLLSSV